MWSLDILQPELAAGGQSADVQKWIKMLRTQSISNCACAAGQMREHSTGIQEERKKELKGINETELDDGWPGQGGLQRLNSTHRKRWIDYVHVHVPQFKNIYQSWLAFCKNFVLGQNHVDY